MLLQPQGHLQSPDPARAQPCSPGWGPESPNLWPITACWSKPAFLFSCQEALSQFCRKPGGRAASIPGLPKSLGLTGSAGESLLLVLPWPCPAGSWWPVTYLSEGDKALGPGHFGLSAPMARNLESGCAWALGVFSSSCWLWGEAQIGDGL